MRRQKTWRVRVKRAVEDWVDVKADDALLAEQLAANIPGVISVFGRSAIPGGKPVTQDFIMGVVNDDGD